MIIFVCILFFTQTIHSLELKKSATCQTALGMQSGSISDSAITASSSYDLNTVGPKASRARTEQYGGAWCPLNHATILPNEWLEIEFDNLTYLTQVETQGRFDNGRGKEYADYYILMYTRSNTQKKKNQTSWIEYKPKEGENNSTWIKANRNTYVGEIHQLDPPIVANRLRFYPVSKQLRAICMRVEIYGCLFTDELISYSMPQGRTDVNSFGDDTYDGKYVPSTNMLIDGLGKLSDGITGSEDISVVNGHQPWVGWSNDTSTYLTLKFQFDSVRYINRVTIHTNNLFSKEILIFQTAIISFSIDNDEGNYSNAIIYQHNRDDIFEIARPVLIELNNHLAKFVRVDLYFDSKWLLISEVTFHSQIYDEKHQKKKQEKPSNKSSLDELDTRKRYRENRPTPVSSTDQTKTSSVITIELSFAFFIGALLAVGILFVVSLIYILQRKKKLQFQKLTDKPCSNSSCYTYPTLPIRECHDFNAPLANATDDQEYAVPDVNFYSTFSPKHNLYSPRLVRTPTMNSHNTPRNPYPTLKSIPHCCLHQHQYLTMRQPASLFSAVAQETPPMEAMCGNSLMMPVNTTMDKQQHISIKEIRDNDLVFLGKMGDGLFGNVYSADLQVDSKIGKQSVIVKSLNETVNDNQRVLFWKEIELLSTLNHPNVCSLLGSLHSPRTVAVFEYSSLDLYQYLRQQTITLDTNSASNALLSLACQVVSGMKYLSSLQIVHRDLAARNCLISSNNQQLQLTDIAMVKPEYSNDYARVGHLQSRIALRWAAWESIFLNQFSSRSDVWSFGVTLYELFTYARQRPYHMLNNEQFVQQFASLSRAQFSLPLHLPQPELCSKEIYDMMCECWQRESSRRPSFADIHTFLVGKASSPTSLMLPEL